MANEEKGFIEIEEGLVTTLRKSNVRLPSRATEQSRSWPHPLTQKALIPEESADEVLMTCGYYAAVWIVEITGAGEIDRFGWNDEGHQIFTPVTTR